MREIQSLRTMAKLILILTFVCLSFAVSLSFTLFSIGEYLKTRVPVFQRLSWQWTNVVSTPSTPLQKCTMSPSTLCFWRKNRRRCGLFVCQILQKVSKVFIVFARRVYYWLSCKSLWYERRLAAQSVRLRSYRSRATRNRGSAGFKLFKHLDASRSAPYPSWNTSADKSIFQILHFTMMFAYSISFIVTVYLTRCFYEIQLSIKIAFRFYIYHARRE